MAGAGGSSLRLSFLGAAGGVTGSCYLVETEGRRIFVDCGMFQERGQSERNWKPFAVAPDRIDAVLLTHAHLDHCGLLPRLAREGFRGPIYCTAPTAEMGRIVMLDSARLQAEDAENKRKRHEREGRKGPYPAVPLYSEKDAQRASSLFRAVDLGRRVDMGDGVAAEFFEAGHILGSASIRLKTGSNGGSRTVHFSGDIGRWNKPILNDPAPRQPADYLVIESTYGDRVHEGEERIEGRLKDIVRSTVEAGGNLVIPSFAIERSQEVLFYLNTLLLANQIPHLLVFLDSPMATRVTEVFARHPAYLDEETHNLIRAHNSPFDIPGLVTTRSSEESKAINRVKGSVVIIAGAGMCTGGRIKHHLVRNVTRPESAVLFVGYQAEGTLGREIQGGAKQVRILGEILSVRAKIFSIEGFSGHADRNELLRWAGDSKPDPRRVFVTHGEPEASRSFSEFLKEKRGWEVSVPSTGEAVELD
jgi:metallo-beta-lactamase family protein